MLTVSEDEDDLFAAIKAGAQGYLLKNLEAAQLRSMIDAVGRGEAAITPATAARIIEEFVRRERGWPASRQADPDRLTERELEVLAPRDRRASGTRRSRPSSGSARTPSSSTSGTSSTSSTPRAGPRSPRAPSARASSRRSTSRRPPEAAASEAGAARHGGRLGPDGPPVPPGR